MISEATLTDAISRVQRLVAQYPTIGQFASIEEQLHYVLEHVRGGNDGSRLKDMNFGLLTAREVDDRDDETANILYSISGQVPELIGALRKRKKK